MFRTVSLLASILLSSFAVQALGQARPGDAAEGRKLIAERCSTCHATDGPSSANQQAPSLAAVAQMPSTTSLSLHAFLLTSHPSMPNYILTSQDVDDVVVYILSLRR